MMSVNLVPTVAPAKAGAWLYFRNLSSGGGIEKGSQTPDQVRGDGDGKNVFLRASAPPRESKFVRLPSKKMFTRRRGGVESLGFAPYITPVTLNLFQGPFRLTCLSVVGRSNVAVGASTLNTGSAARWVLKQVQHDDVLVGGRT